ncbi:SDR family oxidoreductase [Candidatus Kirkpatrickella diaphorinae]|uniref:SDR family oxidoreductase n=1 Tax=Candidatus Kirkpatrickella diaphorinae TaxID=2984322 RepID=A0ABY6GM45_9PROT|nr:SDR family oxidoreductase [Candidatus Kirkpatrickella diaphorinae]UYH51913.1 SDR family oxidoreductase [Candidatus Kirkpatrickella diaphorinae]
MYAEKYRLDGKVALITGGAQNIGLSCATAMAEMGARVILGDINLDLGRKAAEGLRQKSFDARCVTLDVTSFNSVRACVHDIMSIEGRIDILVASAGICISEIHAEDMSEEQWLRQIDINLNGMFRTCQTVGKVMITQKSGVIIAIGSMSGQIVNRPQGQCAYNASKAGVHHYIKSIAAEWAKYNIRANVIAPTYIETELTRFGMEKPELYDSWIADTPMGRVGQPEEIGSVAAFLASDAASLMTGAVVNVDGGFTAW